MPRKKEQATEDLLRDLMIVQLGLAGLSQIQFREIVGVDMHRVNRIVKHFKKLNKWPIPKDHNQIVEEKLDGVVELLQNLLAPELSKCGVPVAVIGKRVHVATATVVKMLKGVKGQN